MTNDTPPIAQDFIRYDLLTQRALRGVVREVLSNVARDGAPGDHHFYISFRTQAPDVKLSTRLRERYPAEMTVILQHQFWDLIVTDQGFEVGLSFGGVPEKLGVPFDSIVGFYDPSVQFGLKFDNPDAVENVGSDETEAAVEPASDSAQDADGTQPTASEGGAQVVSLDKFRKK